MELCDLPKDVLVAVFRQGDRIFLSAVVAVCRRFHYVVRSDYVLSQRMAPLVFQETGKRTASREKESLFLLAIPPVSQWFSGRFEAHVQFELRLDDGSLKDGAPISSFTCFAVFSQREQKAYWHSNFDLAYFADGDVWCRGNHADYAGGYGKGSRQFAFLSGESIGICVDLNVETFKKAEEYCVPQDKRPNCAVQFSRNGKLSHAPFLMLLDLATLRIGVSLTEMVHVKSVNSTSAFR